MTDNKETICAISTPAGVGGIAVARVSGCDAIDIVNKVWRGKSLLEVESHTAHLGTVIDEQGDAIDQAVATVFRNPRSFTGEDVVEIAVHGSRWVQRELINLLVRSGCRIAEAGEFTRRAFANGRMDLAEAEAVADVIASSSRAAHRIAMSQMRGDFSRKLTQLHDQLLDLASLLELELDFSEEEVEFASREKLLSLAQGIHNVVSRLASTFATGSAIKEALGVTSMNSKRRRRAVSIKEIDLSAEFIVPTIYKLFGILKESLEGSVTCKALTSPQRLSSSIKVINSPKTLEMLARLISSMMIT